jgi:alanyl-tRNA synthetase
MPIANGSELRRAFLEFFRTRPDFPHAVVASSPLVPPDDPTLLFTTAGMVQFKALYSGLVPLPYPRAATVQKCLRAGGKGSDLENVGKTLRHHTFFEMLGNFSFGDYFKRETIRWAWDFCTNSQWMGLSRDRLFPTIYGPTAEEYDHEAAQYYREETDCVNPPIPLDDKENFWGPAGDTGACGPCSEMKYFLGSDEQLRAIQAELRTGGPEALRRLGQRVVDEGDLFLEIWNMVFPQFDQQKDGSRLPLKNKGIDTGAGLERMTVALMRERTGVASTPYETDLMWPITAAAAAALGVNYRRVAEGGDAAVARERLAVNAVADHVRALVFTLAEGVTPSNVGRGYVLRRIQRRALRFAALMGVDRPFMAGLYDAVVAAMGDVYPEIKRNPDFIRRALQREEEIFLQTRDRGTRILDEMMAAARDRGDGRLAGEEVFRLWDTYGFPVDLTREIAEDAGLAVDMDGYTAAMKRQKEEARKSWKGGKAGFDAEVLDRVQEESGATEFLGYETTGPVDSEVLAVVRGGALVPALATGEEGIVVLRATPFYAESGGQVGDTGTLRTADGAEFTVTDTQKTPGGVFLHFGRLTAGTLAAGTRATATVDAARRASIRRHHSAVHLLQSALKSLLGDHITQAGSFVGPDYARFDFTHSEAIPAAQLAAIQSAVNAAIAAADPVVTEVLEIEEARRKGAIAPFGEKYGAVVRVVTMGPASIEFCGGTHVANTAEILRFRIESESSIASGVRRIEATVGDRAAAADATEHFDVLLPLQGRLAAKGADVVARVIALQDRVRDLEKEVARLRRDLALKELDTAAGAAIELPGGARLCVARMDGLEANEVRTVAMTLRDRLGANGVAVVLGATDGKVSLVAAVAPGAQKAWPAGTIVQRLAAALGGKGGGKPDLAQGGAPNAAELDAVVARAAALITG